MKKNLLMMAAVMFGILIAFASCKDTKKSSKGADDDEEETEQVENGNGKSSQKAVALKKVASLEDIEALADYDLNDIDISDLDMDDIDLENIDLSELTEPQANALLDLVMLLGNRELPQDAGNGMTMSSMDVDSRDVTFVIEMEPQSLGGITLDQLNTVLNNPELKSMMTTEMMKNFENTDDKMKIFFKAITTANKNLVVKFVDKNSGDSAKMTITADDLKKVQNQ